MSSQTSGGPPSTNQRKGKTMQNIVTNLWFDTNAEEAAQHYIDVLGGEVTNILRHGPEDAVMCVEFEVRGQKLVGINGGPIFTLSEACSLEVRCADQADIDHVWAGLVEGGIEQPCGWLKDKFGLSWQVTPTDYYDWLDGDPEAVARLMKAVLSTQGKFDLAALRAAYDG